MSTTESEITEAAPRGAPPTQADIEWMRSETLRYLERAIADIRAGAQISGCELRTPLREIDQGPETHVRWEYTGELILEVSYFRVKDRSTS